MDLAKWFSLKTNLLGLVKVVMNGISVWKPRVLLIKLSPLDCDYALEAFNCFVHTQNEKFLSIS